MLEPPLTLYMNKKTCLEREFMFIITMHMILWLCKSFTINSDIFLWGSGVEGKLPGVIGFKGLMHYFGVQFNFTV